MNDSSDKVAKLCIEKYNSLKKTGKPSETEWTVMSAILLKKKDKSLSVVSLATGTKCLGGSELINTEPHKRGCRLSDSHAEVLSRRAFLRYLYDQLDLILDGLKSDVFFLNEEGRFEKNPGISFHFFSSQIPCGDCSIFPKESINEDEPSAKVRRISNNDTENIVMDSHMINKNFKTEDIYRTGAKCVKTEVQQDPKLSGINYHITGPLRTKPGRGDPTLSLSCSDKLAKWNLLGTQGALLSMLIPQIKIETIVIGGGTPFSLESMERGLCKRFNKEIHIPNISQAKLAFMQRKHTKRINPCPTSIIWCAVRKREIEVAVEGRKQGATKKTENKNLLVSRRNLFEMFLKIYDKYENGKIQVTHPKKITYGDCKRFSKEYTNTWRQLKSEIFRFWPDKPEYLQNFIL